MASSVFESLEKKSRKKKLTVTISPELDQLISGVVEELKIKAPHLQFNTTAICIDALTRAVKKARSELEKMERPQSPPDTIVPRTTKFPE